MKLNKIKSYLFLGLVALGQVILLSGCGEDEGGLGQETLSDNITEDLHLVNIHDDPDIPDYVIDGFLTVTAELTIDPDVHIAFTANSGLFINGDGMIEAIGEEDLPIRFTGVQKTPGYWLGIKVRANDVRNQLDHVIVEYAGSDIIASYGSVDLKAGVAIDGASGNSGSLTLRNSTIQNCEGYGFLVEHGTLLRGFLNNTFSGNEEAAVRIDAENADMLDDLSNYNNNNGYDGVEINASGSPVHALTSDADWVNLGEDVPYKIAQSFDVEAELTIMAGATLSFDANQTMYFKQDYNGPNDGIIIAKGTSGNMITFTAVNKTPGFWRGLVVQSNSVLNEMNYCIVEYGGSDLITDELANIILDKDGAYDPPVLKVTNSTIRNSAGCGIVVDNFGGSLTASGNTFSDNSGSDVCD
ncbi:NosD domain-containing protein [Fulvivirga ligni]|uniref:NosD domain-containing protein n=1 Tax=Fulvivirga ligni TaxID=2904246 RepID=UPI001F4425D0|nr:NosD domain-containing protein [Fulvivirga ligni]UII22902.1 hypothetical protein LVD16_06660 [Fulvivirga ligni]